MNIVNQINDCCQGGTFTGSTGYLIIERTGGFPSSNNPIKLSGLRCTFNSSRTVLTSDSSRELISQDISLNPD